MARYRIVTDGVDFHIEREVNCSFLWWKWTEWQSPYCSNRTLKEARKDLESIKKADEREARRHPLRPVEYAVSDKPEVDPDEAWLKRLNQERKDFEAECLKAAEEDGGGVANDTA